MLFNKILSKSLDTNSTNASKSHRGPGGMYASKGFNTTGKSFFTNNQQIDNLNNT